jgi:murein peptide amidase A
VATSDVIGRSVQGRALRLRRLGTGPRKVLWIGGIHGNEPEGAVATAALPQAFEASDLGRAVTLVVLEDANPDGRAAQTRTNAHGVDLNRNFPAPNFDATNPEYGRSPLSQPESKAVHDLIVAEHPALVIACHSWLGASFLNYDGPAQDLAERFSRLSGMPLRPSNALGEATPGSLGSWLSQSLGTAVLTVEWQRGSDSTRDWQQTRAAVLAVFSG